MFLKPSLGVRSEYRFQDTVEEHDSLGSPSDNRFIFRRSQFQDFKNECARQRCDGFKERLGQPMSLYVPLSKGTHKATGSGDGRGRSGGSHVAPRPDRFQAEAVFIERPDLDRERRFGALEFADAGLELFLNRACSYRLALGLAGRGS